MPSPSYSKSGWVAVLATAMQCALPSFCYAQAEQDRFAYNYMNCARKAAFRANNAIEPNSWQQCKERVSNHYCSELYALPPDIQAFISCEMHLHFLAGELDGNAEHDASLNHTISELLLQCDDRIARKLMQQYWPDQSVLKAILFFEEEYNKADSNCTSRR